MLNKQEPIWQKMIKHKIIDKQTSCGKSVNLSAQDRFIPLECDYSTLYKSNQKAPQEQEVIVCLFFQFRLQRLPTKFIQRIHCNMEIAQCHHTQLIFLQW